MNKQNISSAVLLGLTFMAAIVVRALTNAPLTEQIHVYSISFAGRESGWRYELLPAGDNARIDSLENCLPSQRMNALSLEIDGKVVAWKAICGDTLERIKVDY